MAGAFITMEGIDGSGKSTQARLLAERLKAEGFCVRLTREPGGTPAGEKLRELVLSPEYRIAPEAELLLYLADRSIHVSEVIRPALADGCVVICERYADSTLAYQGYGRGLELGLLRQLNLMATGGLQPDLTVVLDLPAAVARLDEERLDRLELEGRGFQERVAEGFRRLAAEEPSRMRVIDGTGYVRAIQDDIAALVGELLKESRVPHETDREGP